MQLIAEKVVIERGGRTILDGVSFTVSAGETLILVGPNGAGKTSLLRALAGFLSLSGGGIHVTPTHDGAPRAELMHSVGHTNAVKAHLTVRENVLFWARFLGGSQGAEHRTDRALNAFALADIDGFPVSYLSAGQRRRVGLARLLASPRPIWLLDEPTASLDAASTERLARVIEQHTAGGGMVVAATHLPLGLKTARELRLDREDVSA